VRVLLAAFGALLLAAATASQADAVTIGYSDSAYISPHTVTATQPFTAVLQYSNSCPPDTAALGSVDWGDGQASTVSVRIRDGGGCDWIGSHTYTQPGSFIANMSGNWTGVPSVDDGAPTAVAMTVLPFSFTSRSRKGLAGTEMAWGLAEFPQSADSKTYTAVIDWGDGQASEVMPSLGGIRGVHTYASPAAYGVKVSLFLDGALQGETTARAVVNSCATQTGDNYVPAVAGAYERWLTLLYHDVLGRAPLRAEIDLATRALTGGATRASIAQELLSRPEATARTTSQTFETLLGRDPASDENDSLQNLLTGKEYVNLLQPDNQGTDGPVLVQAAACDLLGRNATETEIEAARSSSTRERAVEAFLGSTAYRSGLVNQIYSRFLRRAATPSEAAQHGGSDGIAAAVTGSTEYFRRANGGGALVGVTVLRGGRLRVNLSRASELRVTVLRAGGRTRAIRVGRRPRGNSVVKWAQRSSGPVSLIVQAYSRGRLVDATDPVAVRR
jgi:hypothetical protein